MLETLTFEDRGQFVYCRYTGPFAAEPMVDSAKEITEYCKLHGYDAILIDISGSVGAFGDFERYKHATAISKFMSTKLKMAIFARPDQESGQLWETVTRNRNLKTKNFFDIKRAEKWLCAGGLN